VLPGWIQSQFREPLNSGHAFTELFDGAGKAVPHEHYIKLPSARIFHLDLSPERFSFARYPVGVRCRSRGGWIHFTRFGTRPPVRT
jgi:hypothetical protein